MQVRSHLILIQQRRGAKLDIMMSINHHPDVRTTLTLDDDVAAKLREEVRKTGKSFKEVVNQSLRTGLNTPTPSPTRKRFSVKARPLGLPSGLSYDNIGDLIEQLEGPLHK